MLVDVLKQWVFHKKNCGRYINVEGDKGEHDLALKPWPAKSCITFPKTRTDFDEIGGSRGVAGVGVPVKTEVTYTYFSVNV
jgi:hypothetical protein